MKFADDKDQRLSREWQKTFDSISDAVWLLDLDQRILRTNRSSERFFGKPSEELIGRYCWEIVHGMQESIPECPLRRARQSLRRESAELLFGDRWFEVAVDPILDMNGNFSGAVHIVSDITERKRAEEALKESETRNRIIAEMISDYAYIFHVTPEGELKGEWVTESFIKIFGYTIEEIDARGGWQSIVYPDDLEIARSHAQKVVSGEADICEMRFITSGGEIRWLRDYAKPVFDARDKRVVRIYGASQDITERKNAEAEIQKLKIAIEQSGETIMITDTTGTIKYVNAAFEQQTGYSRDEALGRTPRLLKSGKQDEAFYRDLWTTITSGLTWRGRIVNRRKDGNLYTEECTISPIFDPRGKLIGYIAVKRDITEHLRITREKALLEEQLWQAQKLEAVGRLAGGIAHDFNNMLNVILGYGEMLMQKLHPEDPLWNDVNEILEAGKRSAALTRQLLAFSRKQTLQPEVVNINNILRNLEKMLRRLIGEDIDLEMRLAKDLSLVLIDPGQFDQIIINLAVNARDAMPEGGKLTIETANVDIDEVYAKMHADVLPGKYVMISVTDSGCGMDETVLSHIFEPFFTTKEKGKGTGLGLATVYGIVKQSGGHILVYSEPGKGSTFKIYLPQTQEKETIKEVSIKAEKDLIGAGKSVLVVEDEKSLHGLLQTILSILGFKVFIVSNGGEALLLVEEKGLRPDLVITDVVMPGMSGAVLVERLRRNQPDLKVLFMSGYTDDAIVHHGVLDPGTPFIQKPFSFAGIAEKIRQVLRKV